MNKKDFNNLKESVIEAGKVMRGEMKPSREFTFKVDTSKIKPPVEAWAVCVETDDEELMIPGKIYPVKIVDDYILVDDEEDEATFYPKEFFITVSLPAEVTRRLDKKKIAA